MECVMGDKIATFFLKINQFCGYELIFKPRPFPGNNFPLQSNVMSF